MNGGGLTQCKDYLTVTDLARLRGLSGSYPRLTAIW